MKQIVIITHRHHYHICQVAILLAIKQFNPDKITIVFDEVSGTEQGWLDLGEKLLTDLKKIYNFKPGSIFAIPFSSLSDVPNESYGWIRQQLVKLNLHKILSGDEWLVIDGDTLINYPIDPWKYCYINPGDMLHLHHDFFVRYTLNLGDQRVFYNNNPVEFSSVPIRLLSRSVLESLEKYVYELHGTTVKGIRDSFTLKKDRDKYIELSEFDLICNYQYFITKDLLPLENIPIAYCPKEELITNWENLKNIVTVLHGKDNLPAEWYHQFGITINQNMWDLIYPNQKINCNSNL